METIKFSHNNEILTTPEQVIADFCTAYTQEEAHNELWKWVQPVLLDCFRERKPERVNQLVAFYERLEQLINVVYITKEAKNASAGSSTHIKTSRRG